MYNTSFNCTYSTVENIQISEETYRNELLFALGIKEFSSIMPDELQIVFDKLEPRHKKELLSKLFIPECMLLFSYDYFNFTHLYLCDVLKKQDTTQSYQNLLTALSKT